MRKFLITIVSIIIICFTFCLMGCEDYKAIDSKLDYTNSSRFTVVSKDYIEGYGKYNCYLVTFYDNDTRIMYLLTYLGTNGGISVTPLLDKDGEYLIYRN